MQTIRLLKPNPQERYRLPAITPLSLLIEWTILILVALSVTAAYRNPDPTQRLPGNEAEWLTSSAMLSSLNLRQSGYLPHWEPYLAFGESLLDNPFSFIYNPFSSGPSLLTDAVNGLKYSVVLAAIIAALGGWTLGRVLGLSVVGRVLLGLLCLGKGNMLAMIGTGYYQLGVSQAYIPWVIAGTLAILRIKHRRWPLIMTALTFALMFWAGNIWYTLPALLLMALLTLTHVVVLERIAPVGPMSAPSAAGVPGAAPDGDPPSAVALSAAPPRRSRPTLAPRRIAIDVLAVRRMALAGVATLGLSAVTFVPIWINQGYIGGHPNEVEAGVVANLGKVVYQFFFGELNMYNPGGWAAGPIQFYYSYTIPWWYGVLILVLLPPVRALAHSALPRAWQVWSVAILILLFCTIWGAGGNPLFILLYRTVPLLGQWRFVGRALAMATFCLALLAAMRVDSLWKAVVVDAQWRARLFKRQPLLQTGLRGGLAALLLLTATAAAQDVDRQWFTYAGTVSTRSADKTCLDWLRQQYPDKELSLYGPSYIYITPYLTNRIRLFNIAADYHPQPDPSTIYNGVLTRSLPEFGMAWDDSLRQFFVENKFEAMPESPQPVDKYHCLYHNPNAMSYAYTVPLDTLKNLTPDTMLSKAATTDVTSFERHPDHIGLVVDGDPKQALVVTLQELAYPGWSVQLDGASAHLEIIGGQIGVVLPPGPATHTIYFSFQSPLLVLGSLITLLAAAVCGGYVLALDQRIPLKIRQLIMLETRQIGRRVWRAGRILLEPKVFEPKDDPPPPAKTEEAAGQ